MAASTQQMAELSAQYGIDWADKRRGHRYGRDGDRQRMREAAERAAERAAAELAAERAAAEHAAEVAIAECVAAPAEPAAEQGEAARREARALLEQYRQAQEIEMQQPIEREPEPERAPTGPRLVEPEDTTDALIREGQAIPDVLRDLHGLSDEAATRVLGYVIAARRLRLEGPAPAAAPPARVVAKAKRARSSVGRDQILALVRQRREAVPEMIADALGIPHNAAKQRLRKLFARGDLVRVRHGVYALA